MVPKLSQIAAWMLLFAVVVVTVVPVEYRPSTNLPLKVERGLAFAVLSCSFTLAYPRRWKLIVVLACLAAVSLELMQLLVPSRDASPVDATVKVIGSLSGTAGALVLRGIVLPLFVMAGDGWYAETLGQARGRCSQGSISMPSELVRG